MSTTKKSRLGLLPRLGAHEAGLACPANLNTQLDQYTALYVQTYGEAVDAATLIPCMLEAFMAGIGDSGGVRRSEARHRSRHEGSHIGSSVERTALGRAFFILDAATAPWAMMMRQACRSSAIQHDTVRCGFPSDAPMRPHPSLRGDTSTK